MTASIPGARAPSRSELRFVERIHRVRVRRKKLKALISLVRGEMPEPIIRMAEQLKSMAPLLSELRDAQVASAVLLNAMHGYSNPEQGGIRRAWLAKRRRSRELKRKIIPRLIAYESLLAATEAAMLEWLNGGMSGTVLLDKLDRSCRKARHALLRVDDSRVEHFHDCRKKIKALQYQLEFLLPSLPGKAEKRLRQLRKIGNLLGEARDIELARAAIPRRERSLLRLEELMGRKARRRIRKGLKLAERIVPKIGVVSG